MLSSLPHEDRKAVQAREYWGNVRIGYANYVGCVGGVYVMIALRSDDGPRTPLAQAAEDGVIITLIRAAVRSRSAQPNVNDVASSSREILDELAT